MDKLICKMLLWSVENSSCQQWYHQDGKGMYFIQGCATETYFDH